MRREILIDCATPETRIALLEDDVLTEVFVERPSSRGITGNIYKGRVGNVLPGMQAAFVDIGTGRDAFLHVQDLEPPAGDAELLKTAAAGDPMPDGVGAPPAPGRIEDRLKAGQELLVQVSKDPVPEKGARLTSLVSFPGRLLVYLPNHPQIGISRRIEDPTERERLQGLIQGVARDLGLPGGFIVRTAGEGRATREFVPEALTLAATWDDVRRRAEGAQSPSLLHQESSAVTKVLRDVLGEDVQRIVVEGDAALREVQELVSRIEPALGSRIHGHAGPEPLFEARGVQHHLERALRSRVWLKSGGSIVIQSTEALVAVDVNTGKYTGTRRLEETILRTNLEAAVEIVRQIRLRDLGGIIVIDFIDMETQASKDEVLLALQSEMRRDRAKSRVLQISEFGLVEITRQRTKRSLERLLCLPCPTCSGSGRLKSPETIVYEILREVRRLGRLEAATRVVARVHPEVASFLEEERPGLIDPEAFPARTRLEFEADAALRHGQFTLTLKEAD